MKNKVKSKTELYREYNKYVTSINKQLRALENEIPDSVAFIGNRAFDDFRLVKIYSIIEEVGNVINRCRAQCSIEGCDCIISGCIFMIIWIN